MPISKHGDFDYWIFNGPTKPQVPQSARPCSECKHHTVNRKWRDQQISLFSGLTEAGYEVTHTCQANIKQSSEWDAVHGWQITAREESCHDHNHDGQCRKFSEREDLVFLRRLAGDLEAPPPPQDTKQARCSRCKQTVKTQRTSNGLCIGPHCNHKKKQCIGTGEAVQW